MNKKPAVTLNIDPNFFSERWRYAIGGFVLSAWVTYVTIDWKRNPAKYEALMMRR